MSFREAEDKPTSYEDAEQAGAEASDSHISLPSNSPSIAPFKLALKHRITSTQLLVEAYNAAEDPKTRNALLGWLEQYPSWFEERLTRHIDVGAIAEYVELSNIKLRRYEDVRLVERVFTSLCDRSHQKRYAEKNIVLAIARFLQSVDDSVFEKDTTLLLTLTDGLLARLNPERNSFSRGNHKGHSATLFALRQIMYVLHRLSRSDLDPADNGGVYGEFLEQLSQILARKMYFPTRFQTLMVQEDLRLLVSDSPDVERSRTWRRLMHGLSGCAYIYRAVRAVVKADIDMDAIKKGYARLKAACADGGIAPSEWRESLSRLNEAALISVRDPTKTDILTEYADQLLAAQKKMNAGEDRKALRYGMVCQLRVLALDGQTPELRKAAAQEVMIITTRYVKCDDWDEDEDIIEEMLETLCAMHRTHENMDLVKPSLEVMTNEASERVQAVVEKWLDGRTITQMLEENTQFEEGRENNVLFNIVQGQVGVFYTEDDVRNKTAFLRSFYTDSNFAKVDAVFEERKRHVDKFKFEIVYHKEPEATKECSETRLDDPVFNMHRELYSKTEHIKLENMFENRVLREGQSVERIKRILLSGQPGTGKTSITKKMAFCWARELPSSRFKAVFVIPMRELNHNKLKEANVQVRSILVHAVLKFCFPKQRSVEIPSLEMQIEADLSEETTLLIFDGLDESDQFGNEVLIDALQMPCCFLISSRPYNVQEEIRAQVQLNVECRGLGEEHLVEFVQSQLPKDSSEDMLRFLKINPDIERFARVPVTANILCFLWREKGAGRLDVEMEACLDGLYEDIANFIWRRFEREKNLNEKRSDIFSILGRIALDALERGHIQISQALVARHCPSLVIENVLQCAGFLLLQAEGNFFHFAHLTFQEYFAGNHLAYCLCSGSATEKRHACNFIRMHKTTEMFEVTLTFMAQALCRRYGFDSLKELIEIPEESDGEVDMQCILFNLRLSDAVFCSLATLRDTYAKDSAIKAIEERTSALFAQYETNAEKLRPMIQALEKVPNALKNFPHLFQALLKCFGTDSTVGMNSAASVALKIAKRSLQYVGPTFEAVLRACRHSDALFRARAFHYIRELSGFIDSDKMNEAITVLEENSSHFHSLIRSEAIKHLQEIAREFPDKRNGIISGMCQLCRHENRQVRETAIFLLPSLAKETSGMKEQILAAMIAACDDRDDRIRAKALKQYMEEIEKAPQALTSKVLEVVLNSDQDKGRDVRRAAVVLAKDLATLFPVHKKGFLRVVLKGCQDTIKVVRLAAFQALSDFMMDTELLPEAVAESLVSGCEDKEGKVRDRAFSFLRQISRATMAKRGEVHVAVMTLCRSSHEHSRTTAFSVLRSLAEVVPNGPIVIRAIALLCKAEEEIVQSSAFDLLTTISRDIPDLRVKLVNVVSELFRDKSTSVRESSLHVLLTVAKDIPKRAGEIVDAGLKVLSDKSFLVRDSALELLMAVARDISEQTPEIVDGAWKMLRDVSAPVRESAFDLLLTITREIPNRVEDVLDSASGMFRDGSAAGRESALFLLLKIAKEIPERVRDIVDAASKMFQDKSASVRESAFDLLTKISTEFPAMVEEVVDVALRGCLDEEVAVRRRAFSLLGRVAVWSPTHISDILQSVSKLCEDQVASVRSRSFAVLSGLAVELPNRLEDVLNTVSRLACSAAPSVRLLALSSKRDIVRGALDVIDDSISDPSFYNDERCDTRCSALLSQKMLPEDWPQMKALIEGRLKKLCHHEIPRIRMCATALLSHSENPLAVFEASP